MTQLLRRTFVLSGILTVAACAEPTGVDSALDVSVVVAGTIPGCLVGVHLESVGFAATDTIELTLNAEKTHATAKFALGPGAYTPRPLVRFSSFPSGNTYYTAFSPAQDVAVKLGRLTRFDATITSSDILCLPTITPPG